MNTVAMIEALEQFLEFTAIERRDSSLGGPIKGVENLFSKLFRDQRAALLRNLQELQPAWDSGDVRRDDWTPDLIDALKAGKDDVPEGLSRNIYDALIVGRGDLVDNVGIPASISFDLENPEAVRYAIKHAGVQISQIDVSTLESVNAMIVRHLEEGSSYDRLATELRKAHSFSSRRAHNIAVFEMGDAFEAGKRTAVNDLRDAGLTIVKSWLTAGDELVRPEHRANAAAGWIEADDLFPGDGVDRSPTDPGCRCTVLYKRLK